VRKNLEERTGEGQQVNEAAIQYEVMRREADASHELYVRIKAKAEEAGLAAGVHGSDFWIVDAAHAPAKPAAPDLPLYMAITFFAGVWLAAGGAFLMESLRPSSARVVLVLIAASVFALSSHSQPPPSPNTSGLPVGVVRIPGIPDTKNVANPKGAPPVWTGPGAPPPGYAAQSGAIAPFPGPIVPGEMLDVSEFHTPEFHSTVRVSAAGTVILPLIGEVNVNGMDEPAAAKAIAAELVAKGMLLHPQVSVLVTAYVGQDVTVMGEVARPGVYPFGVHHRLLDLISAASGLNVTAGGLVRIIHREEPGTPQLVTLDFSPEAAPTQNPELRPGDTVQVSRAGLVYVVGDVNRPGGFTLEPQQQTTVLQALSLAWGPSQNAALGKALLIHEEKTGRTVTTLNLKRMLRGQDPDLPMNERDILFVPDSAAKNLWNRTMESVVQSAAGVSIYAGMVYSQRF
jgi:polysaccharide export outer membrane protein